MFINVHTHRESDSEFPYILNLTLSEAVEIFPTSGKGWFSVGFHPWTADEYTEQKFTELEKIAPDNRVVAVGECGLDKNSNVPADIQYLVFEKQILLSEKVQKPLIIHCVGYYNELFEIRKRIKPKQLWIIHGFRGKPELARQALKAGCSLAFGKYYNEESVRATPVDKLYIETDESNTPLKELYARIAASRECKPEELIAGDTLFRTFEHFNGNAR